MDDCEKENRPDSSTFVFPASLREGGTHQRHNDEKHHDDNGSLNAKERPILSDITQLFNNSLLASSIAIAIQ
jgi:hypothetical protein